MRKAALNASAASDCEAEVVREDPQAHQTGERGCSRMPAATSSAERARAGRAFQPSPLGQSVVVGRRRPSVPLDFLIR